MEFWLTVVEGPSAGWCRGAGPVRRGSVTDGCSHRSALGLGCFFPHGTLPILSQPCAPAESVGTSSGDVLRTEPHLHQDQDRTVCGHHPGQTRDTRHEERWEGGSMGLWTLESTGHSILPTQYPQ